MHMKLLIIFVYAFMCTSSGIVNARYKHSFVSIRADNWNKNRFLPAMTLDWTQIRRKILKDHQCSSSMIFKNTCSLSIFI